MILAPNNTNLIPIQNVSIRFLARLLSSLFLISLYITSVTSMAENPLLSRKRSLANQTDMLGHGVHQQVNKKLRRLPHVFSRVLELPLKSDADVLIENNSSFFRFVVNVGENASLCGDGKRVEVSVVQMYPGVVKVIVSGHGTDDDDDDDDDELLMERIELDRWRFRLPVITRLEGTTAVCVDGELVVTVPKDSSEAEAEAWSDIERLVEVM